MRLALAVLTLAALALRLYFAPWAGHVVDMNAAIDYAVKSAAAPWNMAYEASDSNYPPASMLLFEFIGRIAAAFGFTNDPDAMRVAVKLPTIGFDLLGGLITYALARRFVGKLPALGAAALFDLNPAIVFDTAYWGQNDTITTVSGLAAVWLLTARRRTLAWVVLAFGVLSKPPVLVLAPLFALEAVLARGPGERSRALRAAAGGIGASLVLGYALSAVLFVQKNPVDVYARLIDWYQVGSSLYPINSANAFNVYSFGSGFFRSDLAPVLFVPLKYVADLAFLATYAAIGYTYARVRTPQALVEAAFLVLLAMFLVLTEMHERYSIYALTFAPALAVLDRRNLWAYGAATLASWLNMEYSIEYIWIASGKTPGLDPNLFAPSLARLCALAFLGAFGAVGAALLRPIHGPQRPQPSAGTSTATGNASSTAAASR